MASSSNSSAGAGQETYLTTSEGSITPASVIAVGAVLAGLACIAVALRFYVRMARVRAGVGIDDWLILVSLVLTVGLGVMMIVGSALGGLARPTPQGTGPKGYLTATDDAEIITEKIFWAFDLVQCFAFGTAKLSVLLLYRRIFGASSETFRWLALVGMVIVSIWMFGFFFAILFRCGTQFWALWAPLKFLLANCYSSTPMFQAFTISDVITDVLILAMPVYWVARLRLTPAKKFGVLGVFLTGAVVIVAGCVRLAIFIQQTNNPYQNADGIGHLTTEIYWSMVEMGVSVVAACLPTIWPLVSKFSLEEMVRTVRSVFSLESLAESTTSSARRRRAADAEAMTQAAATHADGVSQKAPSDRSHRYERFSASMDKGSARDAAVTQVPLQDLEAQRRDA